MTKKVSKKSVKRKSKSIRRQTRKVKSVKRNRRQYGGKLKRKSKKKIKKIKIKQSGGSNSDGDGSGSDESGSDGGGQDVSSGDLDTEKKYRSGRELWNRLGKKVKLAGIAEGFGFNLEEAINDFPAEADILKDINEPVTEIPKDIGEEIDFERADAVDQLVILREIYEKYSGIRTPNGNLKSRPSNVYLQNNPHLTRKEFDEDKKQFVKTCNYVIDKIKKNSNYGRLDNISTRLNAYCDDKKEYHDIKRSPGCMREIYGDLKQSRQ